MSQMEQKHQTSKQKPIDHVTTLRCGNQSRDTLLSIVSGFMNFSRDNVNWFMWYCCLSVHEIDKPKTIYISVTDRI